MSILSWIGRVFGGNKTVSLDLDIYSCDLTGEVFYKELAVRSCVNLIADTLSKSEFLTFSKGKEVRKTNYYLLNVEPNQNQNATSFWRGAIHKLMINGECLVIQQNGKYYTADSFEVEKSVFRENIYKNIVIDNYKLRDVLTESKVFYFALNDKNIKGLIEGINNTHSKLISASIKSYKTGKARRGILKLNTSTAQTPQAKTDLQKLLSEDFKKYLDSESGAVLPLSGGKEFEPETRSATNGMNEGREVRAFIDDIFDFVAMAFKIPPQLIKRDVADTDKAVNDFLAFCVNPLAELISDEINRKLYGEEMYLERTYVKLDTSRIKVVNLKDIASSLDILTRVGAHSIDDNLRSLGKEPIGNEWSELHWITKNYEEVSRNLKGGE